MDPAVVMDIEMAQKTDELIEMYSHLNLDLAELIICPVNNNQDPTLLNGGTHWALLVFYKDYWYYFDSSAGEYSMIMNTAVLMSNMKFIMKKTKHIHHHPHCHILQNHSHKNENLNEEVPNELQAEEGQSVQQQVYSEIQGDLAQTYSNMHYPSNEIQHSGPPQLYMPSISNQMQQNDPNRKQSRLKSLLHGHLHRPYIQESASPFTTTTTSTMASQSLAQNRYSNAYSNYTSVNTNTYYQKPTLSSAGWGMNQQNPKNNNLDSSIDKSLQIEYVEGIPKQDNSYDCGMFVMSFAEAIIMNYVSRDGKMQDLQESAPAITAHIDKVYIYEKRIEIRNLLIDMIRKHSNVYDI
eukprot:403357611